MLLRVLRNRIETGDDFQKPDAKTTYAGTDGLRVVVRPASGVGKASRYPVVYRPPRSHRELCQSGGYLEAASSNHPHKGMRRPPRETESGLRRFRGHRAWSKHNTQFHGFGRCPREDSRAVNAVLRLSGSTPHGPTNPKRQTLKLGCQGFRKETVTMKLKRTLRPT